MGELLQSVNLLGVTSILWTLIGSLILLGKSVLNLSEGAIIALRYSINISLLALVAIGAFNLLAAIWKFAAS